MGIAIAVGVGIAALVGGIIWLVFHLERKRTEALRMAADKIGLEFSPTVDEPLLAAMQVFSLFNKGHSRKMKNVMRAETELANLAIFDYQYTTGGGQSSHTHTHTVVSMQSDSLRLPTFKMRPESFFDRFGSVLGFQDIDFDEHPKFSDSFVLQGEDEDEIRRFFDTGMLDYLADKTGIYVESSPGVFIYLRGGRKKPDEIRSLMDEAYGVYSAFAERLSRTTP